MKFSNRAIRVLGSRNEEEIGSIGCCLKGNPVKSEKREELKEFPELYYVILGWHLETRCYKIIQKTKW